VRRLCNVLDTAARTVTVLAPNGYADENDGDIGVAAEKIVSETALLLLSAANILHHDSIRDRVDAVARLLIPYSRSIETRVRLCVQPTLAWDYASAHVCLTCLGYTDAAFDRLFAQSITATASGGHERLPHRALEQEWLRRIWHRHLGAVHKDDPHLASTSMLGRSMDVLSASRDDVYALTHSIIYLTDLGARLPRLPRPASAIAADAEAALGRTLDDQDYDLGAEVLLTWPLLRRRWSHAATFGFHVLAHVEDEAGFLPSPFTRVDRFRTLSGEERTRYVLATAYHTTYVMGLLCAAALRPNCSPPAAIHPSRGRRGAATALLELLDSGDKKPHWRSYISGLAPKSQDTLAPLLLTMTLQRATTRHDLYALHKTLQLAVHFNLVGASASRQAFELLQRAEVFDDTGKHQLAG
jgi:hypothetical protein